MGWHSPSRKFQGRDMRKRGLLVSVMREFRIMDEVGNGDFAIPSSKIITSLIKWIAAILSHRYYFEQNNQSQLSAIGRKKSHHKTQIYQSSNLLKRLRTPWMPDSTVFLGLKV